MDDKKLNFLFRAASVMLVVSVLFCGFSVFYTARSIKQAEVNRAENEVHIAELQMPTFEPEQETIEEAQTEIIEPEPDESSAAVQEVYAPAGNNGKIVVLDAGHGKSSSRMSSEEKEAEGYVYSESRGSWGEWRHYKNGTFGEDCQGSGCTLTSPSNGSCWYAMGNGDRSTEPEINLNNALAAQRYLESMGYEVRMTRTSNEQNPSMNKRVSYCFPNNNTSLSPDAALYVCIHSNAGGGRGTSYIRLEDEYRQAFIPADYVTQSNNAGRIINEKVAAASGLSANGPIGNEGYLILFNKSPVPIAYMEIGFFDSSSDLAILQSSSDAIGRAIAEGVDEYLSGM